MLWFCLTSITTAANLQLTIQHCAGGSPLIYDSLRYRNQAGEDWSVSRLSYLISGLSLQREDGAWLRPADSVAWMNATTHRQTLNQADLPPGKYQAIRFYIGIEAQDNASDPSTRASDHPLNPNLCGLHWSWQGGYIFMALEGLQRIGDAQPEGYSFHLARDLFRTEITLNLELDLQNEMVIPVAFDVSALFDAAKHISFNKDGTTTHSKDGDPLAIALKANLNKAFSIVEIQEKPRMQATVKPKLKPLYLPKKVTPFKFTMGSQFPMPDLPNDNPLIEERVALGKRLFHETALSKDGTISCASCHEPSAAFTDPRRFSLGVANGIGNRNAMPLFNLAWKSSFFWDGRAPSLRVQALMPIEDHREMDEALENVVKKLGALKNYAPAFEQAFGDPDITPEKIGLAIENFLLTITSHDSKFDRAARGEETLSDEEKRGFELFMTEREPRMGSMGGDCFHCHGGALFTDHQFRNNGLAISAEDLGRYETTQAKIDRGAFSTPSLRNIALTAPYMHDGRFSSLEEVLDHYSKGVQRTETLDPNLAKHPDGGLHLTKDEKKDLILFLKTLTDRRFTSTSASTKN
jgi:cytochrome c peroxidase